VSDPVKVSVPVTVLKLPEIASIVAKERTSCPL